jgi:hypothetical protein
VRLLPSYLAVSGTMTKPSKLARLGWILLYAIACLIEFGAIRAKEWLGKKVLS